MTFRDFIFEKWDNECLAVPSDIDERKLEGELINFRGKQAISAVSPPVKVRALDSEFIKRDGYEYGHSFLLTNIGAEGESKYRLEVTRYFKPEIRGNIVWVYESGEPFVDVKESPCVGEINYSK